MIREDEPKVKGVIELSLFEIKEIVDHTSKRNFGPDWILGHGLMPLSYWAMHKKIEEIGFTNLFKSYLEKALEGPIVLGHEISVLAGHWQFYNEVIAPGVSHEDQTLFMQRLTEFITTTFAHGHHISFDHPSINDIPTSKALIKEALHNPGFFGHNILACVWSERVKQYLAVVNEIAFNIDRSDESDGYFYWKLAEGVDGTAMSSYDA